MIEIEPSPTNDVAPRVLGVLPHALLRAFMANRPHAARAYLDPSVCVWTTQDPLSGSYGYAVGRPDGAPPSLIVIAGRPSIEVDPEQFPTNMQPLPSGDPRLDMSWALGNLGLWIALDPDHAPDWILSTAATDEMRWRPVPTEKAARL